MTEPDDVERLVLAHEREAERFLIEIDGALQIGDLHTDVVDVGGGKIDLVLGGGFGCGSTCCHQHRET
jgi:hypothetical protein